ncbi:MAG: PHP domain-containing protein, partial [Bacteroidetes bacterium]|nr:PHP domain-containing protein [Bacteroidota bacterium]
RCVRVLVMMPSCAVGWWRTIVHGVPRAGSPCFDMASIPVPQRWRCVRVSCRRGGHRCCCRAPKRHRWRWAAGVRSAGAATAMRCVHGMVRNASRHHGPRPLRWHPMTAATSGVRSATMDGGSGFAGHATDGACSASGVERMSATHAELDVMSNFSFLEGGSHPEELVACAAELGYESIAIADRCTLAGAVRAHVAARAHGIGLCIGARLDLWTGAPPAHRCEGRAAEAHTIEIAAFATDRASYAGLCRAITAGRRHERSDADGVTIRTDWHLSLHTFLEHAAGLELLILPPRDLTLLSQSTLETVRGIASRARGRVSLAVVRAGEAEEHTRLRMCLSLAQACGIPAAATQGVRFHVPQRRPLHEVLTAIRLGTTVAAVGLESLPNAERHLRSPEVLSERWRDMPCALAHARAVADRCRGFSLAELRYAYPRECSGGEPSSVRLRRLAERGVHERYP